MGSRLISVVIPNRVKRQRDKVFKSIFYDAWSRELRFDFVSLPLQGFWIDIKGIVVIYIGGI